METSEKMMRLRYAGTCRLCDAPLEKGVVAVYERATRTVRCTGCAATGSATTLAGDVTTEVMSGDAGPSEHAPEPVDVAETREPVETGVAGASARREHAARVARREERIRTAHPHIGGLILALTDDPQSTQAWSRGAVGEQVVARSLEKWTDERVRLLHDRRIPRTRANIDHVAVTPSGVYVIDAKRYQGRPDLRVEGGLLRPRTTTLVVGKRDGTKLLHGVHRQVELVRAALQQSHPDVRVRGMLCFVDADWPLVGGAFSIEGVDVLWPRKAAKVLNGPGPLTADEVAVLHRRLADAFPVA